MVVKQVLGWLIPIAILLWIVYLFLKKLGLAGDAAPPAEPDPQAQKTWVAGSELRDSKAFDPKYWHTEGTLKTILTVPQARTYAQGMYNALKGLDIFGKAYGEVTNILKKLTSKVQVSQVAWEFSQLYDDDLVAWLEDDFGGYDLAKILQIVNKLPN